MYLCVTHNETSLFYHESTILFLETLFAVSDCSSFLNLIHNLCVGVVVWAHHNGDIAAGANLFGGRNCGHRLRFADRCGDNAVCVG